MKTTPRVRECLRAAHLLYPLGKDQSEDILALLDDFATLEAELAALRRVEAENLHMEREQRVLQDKHRWCIGDASNGVVGWGLTMVEALARYDEATKEQR